MGKKDERQRFYGSITVSERGQVVIPAEARRDFDIDTGDKLLVFGNLDKGLWVVKASMLMSIMPEVVAKMEEDEAE